MDINRFTEKAQEALAAAQHLAILAGNQQLDVEHLFKALLDQEPGLAVSILRKADIAIDGLNQRLDSDLARLPRVSGGGQDQVYPTGRLNRLLSQAGGEAKRFKEDYVSVEHLLLPMTEDPGATGKRLKVFGLTRDRLMTAHQDGRGNQR